MLHVRDLAIGYQTLRSGSPTVVADRLEFTLDRGELVCLLGPNGVGKSTLMRTLAGLQAPIGGSVTMDRADVHAMSARERARRVAVVLTDRVDVGLLTVRSLVALGRHPHTGWTGALTPHDKTIVERAIDQVGARELAHRPVADLSDGERQRVMVARALAQEPTLMVLDEVTAFLDLPRRVEVMELLRRLAREAGCAILLSTHDLDLAIRSADRLWLLPAAGGFTSGAPEDLVLSGALEHAFASEGLDFDRGDGSFRVRTRFHALVDLVGEGLEARWTQRALERGGFEVRAGAAGASARVVAPLPHGERVWSLEWQGERHRFTSLEDLVRAATTRVGGRS